MKLSYTITKEDLQEFSFDHNYATTKKMFLIMTIILFWWTLYDLYKEKPRIEWEVSPLSYLIVLWFILLAFFWVWWKYWRSIFYKVTKYMIKNKMEKMDTIDELWSYTLEITEDSLHEKNPQWSKNLTREMIEKISINDQYAYLYDSKLSAIIIPLHKIWKSKSSLLELLKEKSDI